MNSSIFSSRGALRAALAAVAALLLAVGCGGGGDNMSAPQSAPQGRAFTEGTITGFGSIIVNGVRFDESTAQVIDDDDEAHDRNELRLGMSVQVVSSGIDRRSMSAKASRVRFGAAIVGPVSAISAGTTPKTLTVLDQIVEISATTVFDDLPNGFDSIKVGDVLEVHAQFNSATGHYLAKRIEPRPGAPVFKLRGIVADLNAGARTFKIGGALIDFSGIAAADLPSNFANGLKVRVRLNTVKNGSGAWVAIAIRAEQREMEDKDEAEVEGIITAFTSTASFSVNGLPVDASKAAFPDGTAGVVLGARVEVEGAIVNGVLVATKVELEDENDDKNKDRNELNGTISGLNTPAKTFVVRGVTVHYSATTVFEDGVEANLANGRQVEVKGTLSADGMRVEASRIEFKS
jgi:Domain of unknown function (DUF5666)